MPTYDYRCGTCGRTQAEFMSIGEYSRNPPVLACCGVYMERFISVAPGLAVSNALAGDRHYDGLRATDGTDISTRTKHREYMKRNNLTTVDDFKYQWQRDAKERADRLAGNDPTRKHDIAEAMAKLGG